MIFGESIMKKTIVSTIAALGIGFTSYLFASATGIQVAPSAINLDAKGVSTVTIHTMLDAGDCAVSTVTLKVTPEDVEEDMIIPEYTFVDDPDPEVDDLSFSTDSLGHIVVRISSWDDFRNTTDVPAGDATFTIEGYCGEEPFVGMDDAIIIRK